MKTVMFAFKSDVTLAVRNHLIPTIASWQEVKAVGMLNSRAEGRVGRQAYARLREGASVDAVVARLRQMAEIEYAEPPAERHLMES